MKIILKYILTNIKERKPRPRSCSCPFCSPPCSCLYPFPSAPPTKCTAENGQGHGWQCSSLCQSGQWGHWDRRNSPLSFHRGRRGRLKGTALYHEDGYYETVDLVAADLTRSGQNQPAPSGKRGKITDFTGSQVILPDRFTFKYGIKKRRHHSFTDKRHPVPLQSRGHRQL